MTLTENIAAFVTGIGLEVYWEPIEVKTFLPGILIKNGALVIDKEKLLYPGDILHEAGHLAVMPLRIRKEMSDDLGMDPIHHSGELMAIAWSYAACVHMNIDPHIVFHEHGYKGGGANIAENFAQGRYFGVPMLAWQEMTTEPINADGGPAFPHMKNWLCMTDKFQTATA
jgi:hypothetical protein